MNKWYRRPKHVGWYYYLPITTGKITIVKITEWMLSGNYYLQSFKGYFKEVAMPSTIDILTAEVEYNKDKDDENDEMRYIS